MITSLILIRQEDIGRGKANLFSNQIINEMTKVEELDVIGISNGISLACLAVRMASDIARIHIREIFIDSLVIPIFGRIGGIFFTLTGEETTNWELEKARLEKDMKLNFEGQLVVVSKNLTSEQMIPLCLRKLSRNDKLKITAVGMGINRSVNLALELTKGKISKEPIGIELMTLSTIRVGDSERPTTNLEIFLKKGFETKYSDHHKAILEKLRRPAT